MICAAQGKDTRAYPMKGPLGGGNGCGGRG